MTTRWFGEPVRRNEDARFLTGRGKYVDDIHPPGALHAAVLRSTCAHARIGRVDVDAARRLEGVVAVWVWEDLGDVWRPSPMVVPHDALTNPKTQYPLARDRINYVGEAVAFVVATDRYVAEDACDLIEVEYENLPAVMDLEGAVAEGAPLVHEDVPNNVAATLIQEVGDVERAFAGADHVFSERLYLERSAGQPLETRSIVAQWDEVEGVLTMWDTTQAPLSIRNGLAVLLGLPENSVRVVAPDIGGAFGTKIMMFYPEEVLVPLAARRLGRPVKWTEDRREHLIASNHERGQVHQASIALRSDGTILGVKDVFLHDTGAYTPYGIVVPIVTATQLPGPYRLPNYYSEARAVYTNRVPVTPYRGAGRPHGCFVMERLIDLAARELGMDRAEIRFKNFIQPDEFPWDIGLTFQDGAPTRYDSGNYPEGLRLALEHIGYDGFEKMQEDLRERGRYIGLGVASYVEGTGIGPYEGAHVRVDGTAQKVVVATCVGTQGQGHQTSFAQLVADELGVRPDQVTITTGDSRSMNWGSGTYASRSAVVTGNAVGAASRAVREKAAQLAAELFEANPADIAFEDERVFVQGSPDFGLPLWDIAVVANPIRYAYGTQAARAIALLKTREGPPLPEGTEPGLEARKYFSPAQATFASGNHAAIVEVDPETGIVTILKYVAVHDCGRVINPLIVEGQVHGGVAQGIGGSFYERLVYDGDGQPLSTTFMDFLIPTAMEVPEIECVHVETPSPLNPLGIKGAGEAGVIPVAALMAQALEDALSPWGVRVREMPLNPGQIRALIRSRG
ncbi:MAG: xanthine dehydrogenase family protein molybdopterin-binding subunit [Chloroflexi bacterium]|nr:xanthine dehydrogenase family protein molybdopterin-binding subunit [Chloroflexota bacterium]